MMKVDEFERFIDECPYAAVFRRTDFPTATGRRHPGFMILRLWGLDGKVLLLDDTIVVNEPPTLLLILFGSGFPNQWTDKACWKKWLKDWGIGEDAHVHA